MSGAPKCISPRRILIVDDNELGLAARKSVLAELGHVIVTSIHPGTALEICSQQNFDLVVTDFRMPGMDGMEFIQHVRAIRPAMPIILLSGFTDALGLTEASTGADAVIQKSSNEVSHLIRCVNRLLKPVKKPVGSQGAGAARSKRKVE
jgi:CheY-like chemotaxis protein